MKDILKSIPKFMYVIFVVLILIIILICIPFESFEKKSDNVNNEYQVQEDNSGDIDSINDKIKEDNEELGVDGEEVSTEGSDSENYFDFGSVDVTDDDLSYINNMDFSNLDYNYENYVLYSNYVSGVGASIEKLKPVLIDANDDVIIRFADLVLVSFLDDNTVIFKLNKEDDDLFIYHSMDVKDDVLFNREIGSINTIQLYMGNLSIQMCGDKEVLVGTYEIENIN